jgi:hypothetical protein
MKGFPSEETIKKRLETKRLGYPPVFDYSRLEKKAKAKRENKVDFAPIFFLIFFVISSIATWYGIETISNNAKELEVNSLLQAEKDKLQAEKTELAAHKALYSYILPAPEVKKARLERIEFEMKLANAEAEKKIMIMNADRKVLEFQLRIEREAKLYEAETQRMIKEVLEKK